MIIRRAGQPEDAVAACEVLRRSIRELCTADHHDDPATLEAWLANKTADNVRRWIATHIALVAERETTIVGFGVLAQNGTLLLLYVDPSARATGVSSALLAALELEARRLGVAEVQLESSVTALGFYQRRGYQRRGDPVPGFGVTITYPLRKPLTVAG